MRYVNVYYSKSNMRSRVVAQAMARGIRNASSDRVQMLPSDNYKGIDSDIAVFYGLSDRLSEIMQDYSAQAVAVHIDLGYWRRRIATRYDGYHKITINSRHPDAYFRNKKHSHFRFNQLGLRVDPWQNNTKHIMVAGMSAKAAIAEGFSPEEWEKRTIERLRSITDRKIIYRPKPNWSGATLIQGTEFQRNIDLRVALCNCHAVVTHHSNVAVDALLAGVPVFCERGVASVMSVNDYNMIETPLRPDDRNAWANDVAYCQWSLSEMSSGLPWKHLKSEGLLK